MSITLADIFMLTGLNITGSLTPYDLLDKGSHKVHKIKAYSGWSRYIKNHVRTGSVGDREHTAFLNMWLEKFLFCGSSFRPTVNHQYLAEQLVARNEVPLGKYLLGSAYSLLHHVSMKLLKGEPIGAITGPWWFIQLWLHTYMHQLAGKSLRDQSFPSSDFSEDEKQILRRCTSFGEAASAVSIPIGIARIFKHFYNGFTEGATIWFAYEEYNDEFELPYKFRFRSACVDEGSSAIFQSIFHPGVLPVGFYHGHTQPSYEFYYPSVAARQFGFGQLPIKPFFADKLKPREPIKNRLEFGRILQFELALPSIPLSDWKYGVFTSSTFDDWWSEWHVHLFCESPLSYCSKLDAGFNSDSEVKYFLLVHNYLSKTIL